MGVYVFLFVQNVSKVCAHVLSLLLMNEMRSISDFLDFLLEQLEVCKLKHKMSRFTFEKVIFAD